MRRLLISLLLPLATVCFVLGLTMPLLQMERLYFFQDQPTLIQVVAGLWIDGERTLAGLVAAFSIGFPALKILALHVGVVAGRAAVPHGLMAALGKWSMMDVMLVALVVFAAKSSGLATAMALPGLWFYGTAALSTALAAWLARPLT